MKRKKVIIIILTVIFLLILYTLTSVSGNSRVIIFNDTWNTATTINANSSRSKYLTVQISVKQSEKNKGTVIVEIVDNNGKSRLKMKLKSGQNIKKSYFISRGGNEKIIITPKDFEGQVTYSEKLIKLI